MYFPTLFPTLNAKNAISNGSKKVWKKGCIAGGNFHYPATPWSVHIVIVSFACLDEKTKKS